MSAWTAYVDAIALAVSHGREPFIDGLRAVGFSEPQIERIRRPERSRLQPEETPHGND